MHLLGNLDVFEIGSHMRRFAGVLVLAVLIGGGYWGLNQRAVVPQSDEEHAAASDTHAAPAATGEGLGHERSQDLAAFRSQFLDVDQGYSDAERAQAETLLSALEHDAVGLSDAQFQLRLAEIVALSDNGHSLLFSGLWVGQFNRVSIRYLIADGNLYVADAPEQYAHLIGHQVLSIGGQSWPGLEDAWSRYQGGRIGWRREYIYFFIESPEMLHAGGLIPSERRYQIDSRGVGDNLLTRTVVTALDDVEPLQGMEAYLPPSRTVDLYRSRDPQDLSLAFQEPDKFFRYIAMPDLDAAYIQFRSNQDQSENITANGFAQETLAALRETSPRYIILDQRFNQGGDLNTTRNLMEALGDIVGDDGHVYIFTSGRTFSAGISSVGYAKQSAGNRASIIGEPVGDEMEFWAEGSVAGLPNSGAAMLYATERHNYSTGCPESDCHQSIRNNAIELPSLDPDVTIAPSFDDFDQNQDPVMDHVLGEIADYLN